METPEHRADPVRVAVEWGAWQPRPLLSTEQWDFGGQNRVIYVQIKTQRPVWSSPTLCWALENAEAEKVQTWPSKSV